MIKLYNTQSQITSNLAIFFKKVFPTISKPHLKILPAIIFGMIQAESVVTTDIVKKLKDYFYFVSPISDIKPRSTSSLHFPNVYITKRKFKTKLVVSKSQSHKEPFYIFTNGNYSDAVKHYGYRFGSIEFIFKNHKSNGFYSESSKMRNIHAFSTLFGIACIAILWLTILGIDYSKNSSSIKKFCKFRSSKRNGASSKRIFSPFNTRTNVF